MGFGAFCCDDGPAIWGYINSPSSVAVDASGNLYIADRGNHRIRKVTAATGVISPFAGTGVAGTTATSFRRLRLR